MNSIPHNWLFPNTLEEAAEVQKTLANQVSDVDDLPSTLEYVAGVDVSNFVRNENTDIYAAIVILRLPELRVVEKAYARFTSPFPYVPGFLGFREVPALVETYQQLKIQPDLLMVDGHGVSHPRRLGIASHLGVLLDKPTIGVAKSILVGKPAYEAGQAIGDRAPLVWKGNPIGTVLRTKPRCNPLYISNGHHISLETACALVIKCLKGYRLPETTRQAHLAANEFRTGLVSISH